MRNNISKIIGIILLTAGFVIFLSPELIQYIQSAKTDVFVTTYHDVYGRSESDPSSIEEKKTSDPLYHAIENYNQSIYESGQNSFSDPWFYEPSPIPVDGFDDGVFGYIEIPDLGQTFALYIGATMDNMSKGAAIMGQTSIPIGGSNANSVIAGHRGYNWSKTFFKDIEDIHIGSNIFITNPWEKLTYRVESIDVIDPYDGEAIKIQTGRDMITLLTCHPYGSHGKWRYLVYCVRDEKSNRDTSIGQTDKKVYNKQLIASDGTSYELSGFLIRKEIMIRQLCAILMMSIIAIMLIRNLLQNTHNKKRS